jgi:hypothetical protein
MLLKTMYPSFQFQEENIQGPVERHTERVLKKHRCPMKKT